MIVYKVIIQIEKKIEKVWLKWMYDVHIPEIMDLKIFYKSRLYRIIKIKEEEFSSFCIEYYCHSEDQYNIYKEKYSKDLQIKHLEKFKGKFNGKRLILSLKNEFASKI